MPFEPEPGTIRDRMKLSHIGIWATEASHLNPDLDKLTDYLNAVALPPNLEAPFCELILLRGEWGDLPNDDYQFLFSQEPNFRNAENDIYCLYEVQQTDRIMLGVLANQFVNEWLQSTANHNRDF